MRLSCLTGSFERNERFDEMGGGTGREGDDDEVERGGGAVEPPAVVGTSMGSDGALRDVPVSGLA